MMNRRQYGLADASARLCIKAIFIFFKTLAVLAVLTVAALVAALVAAQSSVAPVSARLLVSLGVEYASRNLKPYRPYFPEPYLIQLEQE